MKTKYRQLENSIVKEFNDEEFSITHFITTEDVDRYGDIVIADGMDDNNYRKNPVVLYGHDSGAFPVGKNLWLRPAFKDGVKGILAKTQFTQATEEGRISYQLWKEGMLSGSSIGFMPKENGYEPIKDIATEEQTGWKFNQWELLEYSIVPIPANPKALRLAFEKGMTNNRIYKDIEDAVVREEEKIAKESEQKEIESLVKRVADIEKAVEDTKDLLIKMHESLKALEETVANNKSESEKNIKIFAEIVANKKKQEAKLAIQEIVRGAISNINK